MTVRALRRLAAVALLVGASAAVGGRPVLADGAVASAEGDLMAFGPAGGATAGLSVEVLEDPSLRTTTEADGHWRIDGIAVGSQATFSLRGDVRYPIQTATFTVPADGLKRVSFQSPHHRHRGCLRIAAARPHGPRTLPPRLHRDPAGVLALRRRPRRHARRARRHGVHLADAVCGWTARVLQRGLGSTGSGRTPRSARPPPMEGCCS